MIKRKSNEKKKLNRVNEDTAQEYGGKMPPNALELEVQVLGAILLDNMVFSDIVVILRPEFFYRTAHSTILEAMIRIDNRNEAMDGMTVIEELKRMGKLEAVGGVEYILNITESTSSSANAKQYARIIYEKFVLRDLIHISSEILGGCFNPAANCWVLEQISVRDY